RGHLARAGAGHGPPHPRRRPRAGEPHLHPPVARPRRPGGGRERDHPLPRRPGTSQRERRSVVPAVGDRRAHRPDARGDRQRGVSRVRGLRPRPARLPGPRGRGCAEQGQGLGPARLDHQPPLRPRRHGGGVPGHRFRDPRSRPRAGARPATADGMKTRILAAVVALLGPVLLVSCRGDTDAAQDKAERSTTSTIPVAPKTADPRTDIYAATAAGMFSPAVAGVPTRVYVPNSESNTVDVIDPNTFKVIDHFDVGRQPQHVTPSWDLRTLYVDNDLGTHLRRSTRTPGSAPARICR